MEIIIDKNSIDKRLDSFLAETLPYSRNQIASVIENILVNKKSQKVSYKLKLNDVIEFDEDEINNILNSEIELKPYEFKLDVIYEDDDLAVINKPKGIMCHPTKYEQNNTLANALVYRYGADNLSDLSGKDRLGILHRLDKNTAGLMVIAKNNVAHQNLSNQIKTKELKRKYLAIALGEFEKTEGTIDYDLVHYIKDDVKMRAVERGFGLEAITEYKVIEQFKGASLVELELKTGRTHQIRCHLAKINHPIFGDSLYGAKSFMRNEFYNLKTQEQLLQSYYISFTHPKTSDKMEFVLGEEQFAPDFIKVLKFFRRNN